MLVSKEETAAVVIDIQEKLVPHIHEHEQLLENCRILIAGLQALDIPILLTEQYSKGLGTTVSPIRTVLHQYKPLEKMSFSCCGSDEFVSAVEKLDKKYILICGMEAHVCVLQTCLDLSALGHHPILIEDCVSSRKPNDKRIAIERMRQWGITVSSYESILFELCKIAGTETFKIISRLVK
jgi:nicotinamidase-related amidase